MIEILKGNMKGDQHELELDITALPEAQCKELENYVKLKLNLIGNTNKPVIFFMIGNVDIEAIRTN